MKRVFLLIIAAMVFASCQKEITPEISVDLPTAEIDYLGGSISVGVTSNVSWTASCDVKNVNISPSVGNGGEVVTITISKNESVNTQPVSIVFTAKGDETSATAKTVITQAAKPFVYVAQKEFSAPQAGGGLIISVYSNRAWEVESVSPSIPVSPVSGENNGTLTFFFPENRDVLSRQFVVKLTLTEDKSVKSQFTIKQLSK